MQQQFEREPAASAATGQRPLTPSSQGPLAAPPVRPSAPPAARGTDHTPVWVTAAAVAGLVLSVALRAGTRSDLWLDEALSLNIARLPLHQIDDALRQDGAPPLYYVLLHFWTGVFGDGPSAARSLSGLFSLAALPLAWIAGRRLGGRDTGAVAVLLLASSPFAIRYATEARMYALVQLLALAGYLLLRRALEQPTRRRLVPLALVAGLLPLTHYWALFLLMATAVALLALRRQQPYRRSAPACLASVAAGGLLFLPWVPLFLFQVRNTGNPWNPPAELGPGVVTAFLHFGGSVRPANLVLGTILGALTLLALVAPWRRGLPGVLVWATPPGVAEAAVALGALVLGLAVSNAVGAAFSSRYASAMFPIVILAAASGTRSLRVRWSRHGVIALAVVLGLAGGLRNAVDSRTQAGEVAAAIAAEAAPGDVVGYCPDQLGPAVSRMLPPSLRQVTFPGRSGPDRVNWVDYAERHERADPRAFALYLDALAGRNRTVWLVWREGYRTLGSSCERIAANLRWLRPSSTPVTPAEGGFETHYLLRAQGG